MFDSFTEAQAVLEIVVIIGGAAFVIATVKQQVASLVQAIVDLRSTVGDLRTDLREIDHRQDNHETRITVLEHREEIVQRIRDAFPDTGGRTEGPGSGPSE